MDNLKFPRGCRRPKEVMRGSCWEALVKQGWTPEKKGWPSFMAWKGDTLALVESHPNRSAPQQETLRRLFTVLTRAGVQCYHYTPAEGFKPFNPASQTDAEQSPGPAAPDL